MTPRTRSILHALSFLALLALLYAVALPLDVPNRVLGAYGHQLLLDVGIAITLAVSLNLILGIAGQFSIGHAGFLAAGAYTSAVIAGYYFGPLLQFFTGTFHVSTTTGFQLIMVVGMIAGAAVAALMGLLVGLPTLRLRGDYLAIATLGFGEILAVFNQNTAYLGGSTGLSLGSMRFEWLAAQMDAKQDETPLFKSVEAYMNDPPAYSVGTFAVFAVALLTIYIVHNIKYATSGRALLALREDTVASESVGVPTTRYKVAAFVIGATLAGLAGGLVSHEKPLINPEGFRFMRSIEIVAMVILGGGGSITGSVIVATVLTLMPEALRTSTTYLYDYLHSVALSYSPDGGTIVAGGPGARWESWAVWVKALDIEKWRMVLYSLFIIAAMLFRPQGLFGRYEINEVLREDWRHFRALRRPWPWIVLGLFGTLFVIVLSMALQFSPPTATIGGLFAALLWLTLAGVCAYSVTHLALEFITNRVRGAHKVCVDPPEPSAGREPPPTVSTLAAEPPETPETPASTPLLQATDVTMQFGGLKAVDTFNLTLLPGELVGLIGPNGAGKTTVFNVLTGVYRPTRGDIAVASAAATGGTRSIVRLKPHAISHRGVARTFQNIRLFGNLSVLDNVQIAQHAHHKQGIPAAVLRTPAFFREEELSRKNALGYLDLFGLAHLADERANALSYGDQRRLEIARALATRPRVLLLDEPAAGMNPTEKRELMEMIRSLRSRFGLTILLIEHDMKVIMGICQRILVLDYGKTIATGSPAEIRQNPAVIEAYLGAAAKH